MTYLGIPPFAKHRLSIDASDERIALIGEFLKGIMEAEGFQEAKIPELTLATEEAFTNIVHHGSVARVDFTAEISAG